MNQIKITPAQIEHFFDELKKADYFKYVTDKSEIEIWEKIVKQGLLDYGWLRFPSSSWIFEEKTGEYSPGNYKRFDYRTIEIDANFMFRGGMEDYLQTATEIFEIRGLKFTVRDEQKEWGEENPANNYEYFKHEVYINDKQVIIAEGNLNDMDGLLYFEKYKAILEEEFLVQGSNEKIALIQGQDNVVLLIGEEALIQIYQKAIEPFENKFIEL